MLLVTGASGFLGSAIASLAKARGMAVRGLARATSDLRRLRLARDEIVLGDLGDPASLDQAVQSATAVVHCAATMSTAAPDPVLSRRVNVEGTARLLEACDRAGLRRFIQISSQSATPRNPSVYGRTKYEADQRVRASNLDWTILKPGLIYGPGLGSVFGKVVEFTEKFPVVPVLGDGRYEQRPVHVGDVAWAALRCLSTPAAIRKEYDLGGADAMEFNAMIRSILAARGRRKRLLHVPLPLCLALAWGLGLAMKNPPVTADNVYGVRHAPHVDNGPAERDLGYRPRSFEEGLRGIFSA